MKKGISILLCLVMVFSSMFYLGAPTIASAASNNYDETKAVSTLEEVSKLVREKMVNRETGFTVLYKMPVSQSAGETWYKNFTTSMFEEVFKHTEVPTEGDYLFYTTKAYNVGKYSYYTEGGYNYFPITVYATYYTTAAQEKALDKKIDDVINSFNFKLIKDSEKMVELHLYIMKNVKKSTSSSANTAYSALVNKSANHIGTAVLYYRLALESGLDARVVTGKRSGVTHAWNVLELDFKYYYCDVMSDFGKKEQNHFAFGTKAAGKYVLDSKFKGSSFTNKYPIQVYPHVSYPMENGFKVVDYKGYYDGQPHTFNIEGGNGYVVSRKITYSDKMSGPYVYTKPSFTEIGTHKVYFRIEYTSSQDFNSNASGYGTVTIEAIPISNAIVEMEYYSTEYDGTAKKPKVTVPGLVESRDYTVQYENNVNVGIGKVTIKGTGIFGGSLVKTFVISEPSIDNVDRIYGADRYTTSFEVANKLKEIYGVEKFDNIIVASGLNYADALSGTYLANYLKAPIITVGMDANSINSARSYIVSNLSEGGRVYVLGGHGAVNYDLDYALRNDGITAKRLYDNDRFETNNVILTECDHIIPGDQPKEILICSGYEFADGLSVSSLGKPVMLVGKDLTYMQKSRLTNYIDKAIIIGGTGAVSKELERQIAACGVEIERIEGKNRFETATAVADYFFGTNIDQAVLAYGLNFPDALSGGPLAYALKAPLILTTDGYINYAQSYDAKVGLDKVAILGGPALISNKSAKVLVE